MQSNSEGTYAYKILKELKDQTKDMLIIEEGTLYPLLAKLEHDGLIESTKQETGRKRKYYYMSDNGIKVFNHISGYFAKLSEAISPLFDISVGLKDRYLYCPNCANKIDILNSEHQFCEICGLSIKELKERRLEK
jgi:PadR family transcriptional regulator PadR